MILRNTLFVLFFILSVFTALAQDTRFSQFYAAPIHSNPGFTGATIEHRFVMNYRNQWPSIPGGFQAFHATYEYNASDLNSGFGLIMGREDAGSFGLTTTTVAFSYAYRIRINRNTYLMPGLKFGYASRGIDFSKLVFNDQLESNNSTTLDVDAFQEDNVNYLDISFGGLLYSENYWVGASLNHVNEPNQTFLGDGEVSALPKKFTLQAGYKFKLAGSLINRMNAKDITVAMHYDAQGKYDQFDLGFYYTLQPIVFGVWYRGIQGLKAYDRGYANNDALVLLMGLSIPDRNLRLGYSYDITISRLATNTAGAHEISLIYEFASKKSKRKSRRFLVPCAKF
tara:strand:- start:10274 stop:11293 length:1020 start_codon:yes stop_codon:yes gene_type:complete